MLSRELEAALSVALQEARRRRHEYLCVEHVLYALTVDDFGREIIDGCGGDADALRGMLEEFLEKDMERVPEGVRIVLQQTEAIERVMQRAFLHVQYSGKKWVDAGDILASILEEEELHAAVFLRRQGITRLDVLDYISHGVSKGRAGGLSPLPNPYSGGDRREGAEEREEAGEERGGSPLDRYSVSLTAKAAAGQLDPLIGREREIRRALRILCRRRKNNPVFVGEPGTGKTAMAEGLDRKSVV